MSDIELQVQITNGDTVLGTLSVQQFMEWTGVKTQHLQTLVERFNTHNEHHGSPERAHVVIVQE